MDGAERRTEILNSIKSSSKPLSGSALAGRFSVSRQIIVNDVALLRAKGYDIVSTNRGYIINKKNSATRVFKVRHSDDEIEDELNTIVDLGGYIVDVYVNHKAYGRLTADLSIGSRRTVRELMESMRSGKSSPLKNVTSGYHYHTVRADSEEILDLIENALVEKHYLLRRSPSPADHPDSNFLLGK